MRTIGGHTLLSLLGKGGFGEVWRARDDSLGRDVALKLLALDDPEDVKRFTREAQAAAALDHPNIARVFDVGAAGGRHYIAMQLVDGTPPRGPLPPRHAARIVRDAARAVQHAHDRGIIHRDLKPANLMVAGEHVYVMDFGLARTTEHATLTASGMLLGTPAYMSPEQARGERATPLSDVYSLGATLHELLAGSPPFQGDSLLTLLTRIVSEPVPPLRAAPPDLAAIAAKCLEKDPARRYATATALADDLDRFLQGVPIRAAGTRRFAHAAMRSRLRIGAAVAALLAAVAAAILLARATGWRQGRIAQHDRVRRLTDTIAEVQPLLYVSDTDIAVHVTRAERALDELRRVEPKDADVWTAIGAGALFVGDLREAESALEQALRTTPDHGRAHALLGRVCVENAILQHIGTDEDRAASRRRSLPVKQAWIDRALRHLNHPCAVEASGSPFDRDLAAVRLAYAAGDRDAVAQACRDGLARAGDAVGTEEFWFFLGLTEEGDEAVAHYDRALRRCPHHAWARFSRALMRMMQARFAEALTDLDTLIRAWPRCGWARHNRGIVRQKLGDYSGALEDLTAAIAAGGDLAAAYVERGETHFKMGDTAHAIDDFSAAIRAAPSFAYAWYARARVRQDGGLLTDALPDYDECVRLAPNEAAYFHDRGVARSQAGDDDGAIEDYTRALAIDPRRAVTYGNRAELLEKKGDLAGAFKDWTAAVECDPRDVVVRWRRGLARCWTDPGGAIEDYTRAIELDPTCVMAWLNRGLARRTVGDTRGAVSDYDETLRLDPTITEAWYARGVAREALGDPARAIDDFNEAIRLAPARADAYNMRGVARRAMGQHDAAGADFDEAIRRDPKYDAAYGNRGLLRRDRRDFRGALEDADTAVRLAPDNPRNYANRGFIRRDAGDRDGAVEDLTRALRLAPADWPQRPFVESRLKALQ